MDKRLTVFVICCFLLLVLGCADDDKIQRDEQDGSIIWNDSSYSFYGALADGSLKGKQIGIVENDPQIKFYEVKGYDRNDWLIEYLDAGCAEMSLYKADHVRKIPSEFLQ